MQQSQFELEVAGRVIYYHIYLMPTVQGDLPMLRQVFRNLMGNAIKYTQLCVKASIEIGSIDWAKDHVFFVKDNGLASICSKSTSCLAFFNVCTAILSLKALALDWPMCNELVIITGEKPG